MLRTQTEHYSNLVVLSAGIREAEQRGAAVRQIVVLDSLKESFDALVVFEYEVFEDKEEKK
jgi:hypothetical protein